MVSSGCGGNEEPWVGELRAGGIVAASGEWDQQPQEESGDVGMPSENHKILILLMGLRKGTSGLMV